MSICSGKCDEGCGLWWNVKGKNDKGEEVDERRCGFIAIADELLQIKKNLLGVQQATESNRNLGVQVGLASVEAIDKGFKRMAKAVLVRDNPSLAVLDD